MGILAQTQSDGGALPTAGMVSACAMEGPDFVRSAHDAFIEAGADVITTNSYAIVPFHIGEAVFRRRAAELLDLAEK